jgi:hypothetical protein
LISLYFVEFGTIGPALKLKRRREKYGARGKEAGKG